MNSRKSISKPSKRSVKSEAPASTVSSKPASKPKKAAKPDYKSISVDPQAASAYPDVRVNMVTVRMDDGSIVQGINQTGGKVLGSVIMPIGKAIAYEQNLISIQGTRQYWPVGSTPWG